MSHQRAIEWADKARKDGVSLDILIQTNNPDTSETICFLAQQAVEKLIKGLLVQKKVAPPKTHNLIELQFILEQHYAIGLDVESLEELSVWAVESRYPGVVPTWAQACSAADCCRKLQTMLLPLYEGVSQ